MAATLNVMARYSEFLGRSVEVHYRAGDILLPASGTFVADSGRSIFLEQSFVLHGQTKHFRWEIPYQYIVRLEEKPESQDGSDLGAAKSTAASPECSDKVSRATATASGATPTLIALPDPTKTA
ncbi:MAG TPA: hypothetical protein VKQ28_17720 [Candidatus Acidoferrum sp.]|nr:hypothetical protein [Candidatus Acidoferrum sp.]